MIFLIIAVNLSITLLNIYIAVRIWQLRIIIARIATILVNYESYFRVLLEAAPQVIYQGQYTVVQAHQRYQLLQLQTTKIRQLFWLLNQSYQIWSKF